VVLLLLGLALAQLVPLPAWARALGDAQTGRLSTDPHQTLVHLLFWATCAAAFFLARAVAGEPAGARHLVYALAALGAFEAFYGLVQYLTGWQQIFTYVKRYALEDATGTYINRNHFAFLLEMVCPFVFALGFWRLEAARAAPGPRGVARALVERGELYEAMFWMCLGVVLLAALAFSRSRMGILSAGVSLGLLVLLRALRGRRRAALAAGAGVALAGLLLAGWLGAGGVAARFAKLERDAVARWLIWQDSLALFRGRTALVGSGLGTFPTLYTQAQTAHLTGFVNHAHSDYLELAADMGLPGAAVLFGGIAATLLAATRRSLAPGGGFDRVVALGAAGSLTAVLLHSLTDFNLYVPGNAVVLAAVLGLAHAPAEGRTG
jgi:O-antigen ligase